MTSSGLHSTVTSAPSASGIARSTLANWSAGTSVGVPPPTNTVSAGGMPASTARSISRLHGVEVVPNEVARSVHVANAQ